jgi:glycoside hydrolase-like protein
MTVSGTLTTLPPSWGCDCSAKLSPDMAQNLARAHLKNGNKIGFVWRYVSLNTQPDGSGRYPVDIDPEERDGILNAGLTLLLVQHVNYPGWYASALNGAAHGKAAANHAAWIEYPKGAHIAVDLEGVSSQDTPKQVAEYINAWCRAVLAAGYKPVVYVGYSCGLTPEQLWELPLVDRYWSDFGTREVANRGFCMVQKPEEQLAGIKIDPDQAMADKLGGTLVGMGKLTAPVTAPPEGNPFCAWLSSGPG